MLLYYVILILQGAATLSLSSITSPPTLILVDAFADYLSGHCKDYCRDHDIRYVEVVSSYSKGALEAKGMKLPPHFIAPKEGSELDWAESEEIELDNCSILAESDAGTTTAERIGTSLGLRGNGPSPQLRNKYLMNERCKDQGLKVVRQVLASTWEEAETFLMDVLWADRTDGELECIVKPYRGMRILILTYI
jgi:hypothetical protein